MKAVRWAFRMIAEHKLPAPVRLVLLSLAYRHHDETGACYPTYKTIAADTGMSERAAIDAMKALAATKLITVKPRSVHGHQRSNQYDLFGKGGVQTASPLKRPIRGANYYTPETSNSGVQTAAPDKDNTKRGKTDDANVVSFATAKELKFAGGAK